MNRLDKIKNVIKEYYEQADCGIYFTRNTVLDRMTNIYNEGGVSIDICYHWSYFEVFGLTIEERDELCDYYRSLRS